jgi:hypothetical protein
MGDWGNGMAPFGQIDACGEELKNGDFYQVDAKNFSPLPFVILDIVIWDLFVFCNLYFVIFPGSFRSGRPDL